MKKYYKRFVITLLIALVLGILPTNGLQAAKKVKLNVRKLSVTVKKTKTLKVQNTKKKVKWTIISGKKFVKLKSKKKTSVKVAGIKKGKAKVQAKVGKKKYVCKITVKNAKKKIVKQTPKPSDGMEKEPEDEKPNTVDVQTGYDKKEVGALRKIIAEQKMLGAEISENINNNKEYTWEKGKLVAINWENKNLSGNLNLNEFTNLEELFCSYGSINSLDVTKCIKLQEFYCISNELTKLDISKCVDLIEIMCYDNKLNLLDFTKCLKIEIIWCNCNNLTPLYNFYK